MCLIVMDDLTQDDLSGRTVRTRPYLFTSVPAEFVLCLLLPFFLSDPDSSYSDIFTITEYGEAFFVPSTTAQ
jgi:hypothetical protein